MEQSLGGVSLQKYRFTDEYVMGVGVHSYHMQLETFEDSPEIIRRMMQSYRSSYKFLSDSLHWSLWVKGV